MGEGVDPVGQVYGLDELFLEIWVDGSFDVFYPIGNILRLLSFGSIQQGNTGTISGSVTHCMNLLQFAIWYQS